MNETSSLKFLAHKTLERLERNKQRNKCETKSINLVSRPIYHETRYETKNIRPTKPVLLQLSSLFEDHEERIAIAEYDGQQTPAQAQRIAYQDAFIAVLNTLPYKDHYECNWLDQRIKATKEWLMAQGIKQP
ncbi:MAG: hypothetical protein BGO67_05320 [Alphaproteobacteria bacterium 41-28]|nr:MAG: hypothetical protein BGO67_05320 [Alphaproteobacteria bacterium 41-28]